MQSLKEIKPLINGRFLVAFLGNIVQAPVDIRCQSISGITTELKTDIIQEGGENLYINHRADGMRYDNLVIKRGFIKYSLLTAEFNTIMSEFARMNSDVLVTLLDENGLPLAGWLFQQAYPVKWTISDLDAERKEVVIDTMELVYARLQHVRV